MTKFKRALSLMVAGCLSMSSLALGAGAVDSVNLTEPGSRAQFQNITRDECVTFEEAEATLKAEAIKHGVEYEIADFDSSQNITQAMLQDALADLASAADNIIVGSNSEALPAKSSAPESSIGDSTARNMPVRDTFYNSFSVTAFPVVAEADIRVELDATVDVQRNAVIQVHNVEAYQYGAAVSFVSWDTTKISTSMNSPQMGWTKVTLSGRARFDIPIGPFAGAMTFDVTNHEIYIQCF